MDAITAPTARADHEPSSSTATPDRHRRRRRRRLRTVAAVAATALLLLAGCDLTQGQRNALAHLNHDRGEYGKSELPIQEDAQAKAQAWAEKLAREGRLYHSELRDGIDVRWCKLGENAGYGPSTGWIQDAYLASEGHRNNALSSSWNGVGIGVAQNETHVYVVQVFIQTC